MMSSRFRAIPAPGIPVPEMRAGPPVGRRLFLALAGLSSLPAPAVAQRRDYIDLRAMIGGRPGPHTPVIAEAISLAQSSRQKIVARSGTYLLDDDLVVPWDGFEIEGEGEATRFVQQTQQRGFLQLQGNRHRVRGLAFACDYARHRPAGGWRGYSAFQRVCAVWVEGSQNLIEAVSGENTFGVVCLRGPVVSATPSSAAPRAAAPTGYSAFNYTRRARGNRVIDIAGRSTDFVLTGNQQEDLLIDGLTARETTNESVPPHAIYMQNPGSTGAFCGFSLRVRAKRLNSAGNRYSEAFKFSDIRDLVIETAEARDTAGGLMISTSDGVVVQGGIWAGQDDGPPSDNVAIRVSQSTRVRLIGGTATGKGGGVAVYHGSEAVDVEGFRVVDQARAGSASAPFRVQDTSEARFVNCQRERRGADRPMFVVTDRGTAAIERPVCRGSAQLVNVGSSATVDLAVDPALIDGWDPTRRSLLGSRERVRMGSGEAPRRPITRPLLGAADNACPS
jgi:hypothetical protein